MATKQALRTIEGNYRFTTAEDAANIEKVTGYIDASGADTKASFPKLTSVGGYIDAKGADTKASFPKLTSVGGSIYARGADTKASFPKLTSVGGYIDASGAEHVHRIGQDAAKRKHFEAVLSFGYLFVDGILAKIEGKSRRVGDLDVYRILICGKSQPSFAVVRRSDMVAAHGDTLAEAKADLLFKMADRPLDAFKNLDPDKKLDFAEGISLYRAVTGACLSGCKAWVEQNGISKTKKYSVNDILKLTAGAYNSTALVNWAKGLKQTAKAA